MTPPSDATGSPRVPTALRRRRLMHALERADDTGLALVVAPPGSGKTTLLHQWASERAGPVHWLHPHRAKELHAEKRREATFFQQRELAGLPHTSPPPDPAPYRIIPCRRLCG